MSDEMPAKLPRYVFRRSNGSFRYKRNVPLHLRALIGKATLYRQLGDSHREAMQNLPLVHARIEALLDGRVTVSCRSWFSLKLLYVQKPRGFSSLMRNVYGVDCRSH